MHKSLTMFARPAFNPVTPPRSPGQTPGDVPAALDLPFVVPYTHRLRFTDDALGADAAVLSALLEPSEGRAARVLAFVDSGVNAATGVGARLRDFAGRHGETIEQLDVHLIDGGEAIKNDPDRLKPILEAMHASALDRRSYVLAIGGGAFLDAVSFGAAVAHRGIRLVRMPTTVMGQADSGVGVKNAINYFGKKNWLGSFAVPWGVINDRTLLSTLPDRDWRSGFSEAVKVSLLKEPAFFDQLCTDAKAIAGRDAVASDRAIRRSAYWHLMHITRGGDPFETQESRPLDFGHWSAHRIEPMTNFTVRHGEAVGIGLAIDCIYSTLAHGLSTLVADRVLNCLRDLGLTLHHGCLADADALLDGLEEFRQHLGGRLTVTMLTDVGRPIDVHEIDRGLMRRAIETISRL
ncbi:MAG: 3-dehydroquinate synthetase [Phycisphaerales bacterium]|nr:3-dehydroquinate synthetase [Phycisphaerales bacterium]